MIQWGTLALILCSIDVGNRTTVGRPIEKRSGRAGHRI